MEITVLAHDEMCIDCLEELEEGATYYEIPNMGALCVDCIENYAHVRR